MFVKYRLQSRVYMPLSASYPDNFHQPSLTRGVGGLKLAILWVGEFHGSFEV